ncbi:hypothetical protein [Nocardia noduli]|uniref:hypothetical protein n=1 Tax=Nocardia noduli TaxID=2815722 RepID=UPI001C227B5B|nr:hypothetical protein [Nocardia noduli]
MTDDHLGYSYSSLDGPADSGAEDPRQVAPGNLEREAVVVELLDKAEVVEKGSDIEKFGV